MGWDGIYGCNELTTRRSYVRYHTTVLLSCYTILLMKLNKQISKTDTFSSCDSLSTATAALHPLFHCFSIIPCLVHDVDEEASPSPGAHHQLVERRAVGALNPHLSRPSDLSLESAPPILSMARWRKWSTRLSNLQISQSSQSSRKVLSSNLGRAIDRCELFLLTGRACTYNAGVLY